MYFFLVGVCVLGKIVDSVGVFEFSFDKSSTWLDISPIFRFKNLDIING